MFNNYNSITAILTVINTEMMTMIDLHIVLQNEKQVAAACAYIASLFIVCFL